MFKYIEGDIRNFGKDPNGRWKGFGLGEEGQLRVIVEDSTSTVSGTQFAALAVSNSADYNVTVSWDDLPFDTTILSNNPTAIYLDNNKVVVKHDSLYRITYNLQVKPSGNTRETDARVYLNGSSVVPGSIDYVYTYQDEVHLLTKTFVAYLHEDDYVTLQVKGDSTPITIPAKYYFEVVEYTTQKGEKGDTGEQGPPGVPGTGSTINVWDDGVLTASGIANLDFGENIKVTTVSGSDTATVDVDLSLLTESYIDVYDSTGTTIIGTSWSDVTFDVERQITNAFTHSGSVITAQTEGEFVINARVTYDISSSTRTEAQSRLLIDTGSGFTVVPGTVTNTYHRTTNAGSTTGIITCILSLNPGDQLKVQGRVTQGASSLHTVAHGSSFTAFSVRGQKGEDGIDGQDGAPGPPGSGSTLLIQDEGSYIANTPHTTLNFKGNTVTVTDAGGGVADIDIITAPHVFGDDFAYSVSESTSSTSNTSFLHKISMVTPTLTQNALYRVGWYYEWNYNSTSTDIEVRGTIGSQTMFNHREEPQDSGSDQWHVGGGYYYYSAPSSSKFYIYLDYRSTYTGRTASIRRARVEFWRVK